MRIRQTGMSLIELMTVVTIVAILGSIALPAYRNYVVRANRTEGKNALLSAAGALERCYTRFNDYRYNADPALGCTVAFPQTSETGLYSVTIPTRNRSTFTLTATPQGKQAGDTACGAFSLDSTNGKAISGSSTWQQCWGR